jgi:hypothetical protein
LLDSAGALTTEMSAKTMAFVDAARQVERSSVGSDAG